MRSGYAGRLEVAAVGLIFALAVVGVALVPVTASPVVAGLVKAVGSEQQTGLGSTGTLDAAEAVRVFVLSEDAPSLPAEIDGAPAFDEAAVSHLVDVRRVLVPARLLTLTLVLLAAAWISLRVRTTGGRYVIGRTFVTSGWMLIAAAGVAVLVGLVDFDAFFGWFHGLFFEPGTWVFPYDALLIRIFPLPFWTAAGALWGGLVLMTSALLILCGRLLCFTRGTHGV